MAKKWRECTSIPDYEFDPEGEYEGSLYSEQWDEIFNELYLRAETTEEWRYNDWIDPLPTRNAYTEYFKDKAGNDYIVLKYYDGMYALYEIKDENEIDENASKIGCIIEKLEAGVSVRQAIMEAVKQPNMMFEAVSGMNRETLDELLKLLDEWTGGSNKNGWVYGTEKLNGNEYVVTLMKNPVANFDEPVSLYMDKSVLNGELYYEPVNEYLAASGPVSFAGLKSILRDLVSQMEIADADLEAAKEQPDGDIYGY